MKTTLLFFLILPTCFAGYYPDEIFDMKDRELRHHLSGLLQRTHKKMSYDTARERMFGSIDLQHDKSGHFVLDLYCKKKVRKKAGPGKIPNNREMNVEHLWPQDLFVSGGGSSQRSDLHHLIPTSARANSYRGTNPFGEVFNTGGIFGGCSHSNRGGLEEDYGDYRVFFEPPEDIKGNIARAIFYFATRYDAQIDEVQEFFLRLWHEIDPVDEAERIRHEKIVRYQKNRNPYIDYPEMVNLIIDF